MSLEPMREDGAAAPTHETSVLVDRLRRELEEIREGLTPLYSELDRNAELLRGILEARGRFLSSMTHEFRTPLSSILSLSQLLIDGIDGPLNAEQSRQIGFIRKSAEALADLMNDLIELSRLDARRAPVHVGRFSVNDLLASQVGVTRPLIKSDQVALVVEELPGDAVLETDASKLSQILRNLLGNAIKYTRSGEIRLRAFTESDQTVTFEVKDTGIGIAPKDQARVFEEFVQVEGPHQNGLRGYGLGLSISRRLAQFLGGRLWVTSEPGKGSTFSVCVRRTFDAPPQARADEELGRPRAVIVARGRESLARYERLAAEAGFLPLPAQDAPYAKQLLSERTPSVLVVDADPGDAALWALSNETSDGALVPVLVVSHASARSRAKASRVAFFERGLDEELFRSALVGARSAEKRPRVLVIDDDEPHRYLLRRQLMLIHVDVVEAAGGREAVKLAQEQPVEAIVLDLAMPDFDGYHVLAALKADARTRDIPVIVHTARQLSPDDQLRLAGADAILNKQAGSHDADLNQLREAFVQIGVLKARQEPAA